MLKNNAIKIGRNDPCPCGSGKKYKRCCLHATNPKPVNLEKLYQQKYGIRLKQPKDIEGIRASGCLVIETLDLMEANIRPGVTTEQLNTIAQEFAEKHQAISAPLNYRGFRKVSAHPSMRSSVMAFPKSAHWWTVILSMWTLP